MNPYQPTDIPSHEATTRHDLDTTRRQQLQTLLARENANFIEGDSANPVRTYQPEYAYSDFQGNFLEEPLDSSHSATLRSAVDFATNNAWQFNANALSHPPALTNVNNVALTPSHGLGPEKTAWAKNLKVSKIAAEGEQRRRDEDQARQYNSWQNPDPEVANQELSRSALYTEVDTFWPDPCRLEPQNSDETNDHDSHHSSSTRSSDNGEDGVGNGNGNVTTTMSSVPAKRQSNSGHYSSQTTDNSMHDSAVCMDDGYIQATLPNAQSTKTINFGYDTSVNPGAMNTAPLPAFYANGAPFGTTQYGVSRFWNLDQFGQNEMSDRMEAPYDTSGLWTAAPDANFIESSQRLGNVPFVNDPGEYASQEATMHHANFGAGTNDQTYDPFFSFDGGAQLQDAAQLGASATEMINAEALSTDTDVVDLVAMYGPMQQYRFEQIGDTNNQASNVQGSPEQAAFLGEDLQRSIHSATSAVSSITRALAQSPSPAFRQWDPEMAPPTQQVAQNNTETAASTAHPTNNEVRPFYIRNASNEGEKILLRTPTPRRITNVNLENLLAASPVNRTPQNNHNTSASHPSRDSSLEVEFPSSPTPATQGAQSVFTPYVIQNHGRVFPQANANFNQGSPYGYTNSNNVGYNNNPTPYIAHNTSNSATSALSPSANPFAPSTPHTNPYIPLYPTTFTSPSNQAITSTATGIQARAELESKSVKNVFESPALGARISPVRNQFAHGGGGGAPVADMGAGVRVAVPAKRSAESSVEGGKVGKRVKRGGV